MKNKKIKIIFSLVLIVLLILACAGTVNAWTPDYSAVENVSAGNTETAVYSVMGSVINIISIVGVGIAIIMLIYLGIMYTMNSVEKKAEIKKQAHSYIIGAFIIFAASAILKIIQMFIDGNVNSI